MKNVIHIIKGDFKALSRQVLAIAIVIAILFIPALYAWFNIYANWDPYGATGNITIAVASEDKGYVVKGERVYKSTALMEQLAAKDSINFVIYDDVMDALSDCEAGKCYGAIVLNDNFTRNMYDLASAVSSPESTITFYENFKINPVANKISESAASSVVTAVQTAYFQALFETVFSAIDGITDRIDLDNAGDDVLGVLIRLRDACIRSEDLLAQFSVMCKDLAYDLHSYDATGAAGRLYGVGNDLYGTSSTIAQAAAAYENAMGIVQKMIDSSYDGSMDIPTEVTDAWKEQQTELLWQLIEFTYSVPDINEEDAEELRQMAYDLMDQINSLEVGPVDISGLYDSQEAMIASLNRMMRVLSTMEEAGLYALQAMQVFAKLLGDVVTNMGATLDSSTAMINSAGDTVEALDNTLGYARAEMSALRESLDGFIEKFEALGDADIIAMLKDITSGDGSELAEFLACPVTVLSGQIYSVSSYGTAMAPFYSTLAIWVGCVVLAAVIKTEAEKRDLQNVTENQLFWSRFLLFLLLNEIQTAIIVFGDVYLLGVGVTSLGGLFLAAAVTSLVFTAIIYSLVLAFGDIGKAIVVVVMVLQIAGSGGTYPIEILTEVFSKLYLFFPFPYAINAMREAISGFYHMDYWKYLGELMIFGVMGLLVGLYVRKPFIRVNAFVEEEMKESGVL